MEWPGRCTYLWCQYNMGVTRSIVHPRIDTNPHAQVTALQQQLAKVRAELDGVRLRILLCIGTRIHTSFSALSGVDSRTLPYLNLPLLSI